MISQDYWDRGVLGYVGGLTLITPPLIVYNLSKLYGGVRVGLGGGLCRTYLRMLPGQFALRSGQFVMADQIQKYSGNTWVGFASIGVMQGIVYGHCNYHWGKYLGLSGVRGGRRMLLAGFGYAGARDCISQGLPFYLRDYGLGMVMAGSVLGTLASHGLHNCQTIMQVDGCGYREAFQRGWKRHGRGLFYKGLQSRIGMMLGVNVLNYIFLRKIWN